MLAPNSTVITRDHGTEKLELAEKIGVVYYQFKTVSRHSKEKYKFMENSILH
jgi:hypothetical protein